MPSVKTNSGITFTQSNPSFIGFSPAASLLPTDFPCFGRAIDGNITLSTSKNINTTRNGSGLSRTVDSAVASVTAISGTSLTVTMRSGVITDFFYDDVVLIINLQGNSSYSSNVGNYEFGFVSSASGTTLTLKSTPTKLYGDTDNSSIGSQKVIIMRLPEYNNVTIGSGGILTASAWNGTWGGVVAFFAQSVACTGTGKIDASALGFRGGTLSFNGTNSGSCGEGHLGGLNIIQATANGTGGGGGGKASASADGVGASNGYGGGGAGGAGGGAGGGGGYATAGDGFYPPFSYVSAGGGGGGGCGVNTGGSIVAGKNASGSTQGAGGIGTSSTGGAGGSGFGAGGTQATGGTFIGVNTLSNIFLGGGGGSAGQSASGGNGRSYTGISPSYYGGGGAVGSAGTAFSATGGAGGGGAGQGAITGGNGGGIVFFFSKSTSNLSVLANGAAGAAGNNGASGGSTTGTDYGGAGGGGGGGGGAGGGAGGTCYVFTNTLNIGTLTATGGSGGAGGSSGAGGTSTSAGNGGTGSSGITGGNGSVGRIRVFYLKTDTAYASVSSDGGSGYSASSPSAYKTSL